MLEQVSFKQPKIKKRNYKRLYKEKTEILIALQQKAQKQGLGIVVLIEGWDGSGKGSRISDILYKLDARITQVYRSKDESFDEKIKFLEKYPYTENYYPDLQQYWENLGAQGTMSVYERAWLNNAAKRLLLAKQLKRRLPSVKLTKQQNPSLEDLAGQINNFEQQLQKDGYVLAKVFLHIRKKTQKRRLIDLASNKETYWRVTEDEIMQIQDYKRLYGYYDQLLEKTSSQLRPWNILNGEDGRAATLAILDILIAQIGNALGEKENKERMKAEYSKTDNGNFSCAKETCFEECVNLGWQSKKDLLLAKDNSQTEIQQGLVPEKSAFKLMKNPPSLYKACHNLTLERSKYKKALKKEQKRLFKLELELYRQRRPLILVYEGWDAAGKGGSIKRVAQALDTRAYSIFTSAAPTAEELAHPYLWRYWTRLPKAGHVGIYDRSWYGRVLVERIEGFASLKDWTRAYDEINAFEYDLHNWGAIILKFWVHVSREEQLERFKARMEDPSKAWKITEEDWRNRDKYSQYFEAVEDMFKLTSTEYAPWILLEGDDKLYARVKALKVINNALEAELHKSIDFHS